MSSFEKYVMDADQLGILHSVAEGVDVSENGQAMGAIAEVQPGGHYLGCQHTQENFKTAFWRSEVLDYKPFEQWNGEGSLDTVQLANIRLKKMLAEYQKPKMDAEIDEALQSYIAKKKESMPDAFA